MKCIICKTEMEKENLCEICGLNVCSSHSGFFDEIFLCDCCSGKDLSFHDRDMEDFEGTDG